MHADLLDRLEAYLESHEDVRDGAYGIPKPNEAMQLLTDLRYARAYPRPEAALIPITVEVFRSTDGRVFANVNQGGAQLAHLSAGESFTIPCSQCGGVEGSYCGDAGCPRHPYRRSTPQKE